MAVLKHSPEGQVSWEKKKKQTQKAFLFLLLFSISNVKFMLASRGSVTQCGLKNKSQNSQG